jgi:hypothetical protein
MMSRGTDKGKGMFAGKGRINHGNRSPRRAARHVKGVRRDIGIAVEMGEGIGIRTPFFKPGSIMRVVDAVNIGEIGGFTRDPGDILRNTPDCFQQALVRLMMEWVVMQGA